MSAELATQRNRTHLARAALWTLCIAAAALAVVAAVVFVRAPALRLLPSAELGAASSCEERDWAATEISCIAAQNKSVMYLPSLSAAPDARWEVRIWLTTLDAVDSRFHPSRQVANHPSSGSAPVWLYIYENTAAPDRYRVLHVAPASNARPGEFVYIYTWAELGAPEVPTTMPTIR